MLISEITIKLGSGRTDNTDAYLRELNSITQEHPFNGRARILGNAAIEVYAANKNIHISDIQSLAPNTGAGSAALKLLTDLADKHHVKLDLTAKAYAKDKKYVTDTAQLAAWYKRMGFHVDDEFIDDPDDLEGYEQIDMMYYPR